MARLELYGTAPCPHTQEMRDWLEFRRCDFVEYDAENDPAARRRMREQTGGQRNVPLLAQDGKVLQGWMARSQLHRGCRIAMASACSFQGRGVSQDVVLLYVASPGATPLADEC